MALGLTSASCYAAAYCLAINKKEAPTLTAARDARKLPVACSGKHAESVSEAIKMRRRNTIQRDAMHAAVKDEHLEHHVHA